MHDVDTTIIGAGVVGLAVARSMAKSGRSVVILERNGAFGSETSARNSEVIHAGIYYEKDSLKARFCTKGKELIYDYCKSRNIGHRNCGKLIVATDDSQVGTLETIIAKAKANGVHDLREMDAKALRQLEPELSGHGGLFSPSTGIIDSHGYMLSLLGEAEDNGASLALNTPVSRVSQLETGGYRIETGGSDPYSLTSREVIYSTGLWTYDLWQKSELASAVQISQTRFAKGNYFKLSARQAPFTHLIYPVPVAGGLGIHLTLDLAGDARFGPDVEWIDSLNHDVDATRGAAFYGSIRRYWPGLPDDSLVADYCGIRPKPGGRENPNMDFQIVNGGEGAPGLVILHGIESPGLTSSLAIADHVCNLLAANQ